MQIWPFESIFRPYPLDGLLEIYLDPDDDSWQTSALDVMQALPSIEEIDDGEEVDLTSHLPMIKNVVQVVDEEVVDLRGWNA
jgi:hypothetical protein